MHTNPDIDKYLAEGCGRCPKGGTPQCKVHSWPEELNLLRSIVLDCGLREELKWSAPCYTHLGKNILMVSAFKTHCAISFFKGALLEDSHKLLIAAGVNSQAVRSIRFTNTDSIIKQSDILKAYIFEAIEIEEAGKKVNFKKRSVSIPEEFKRVLNNDPLLKTSWETLTPGRQREYCINFSRPKQVKTREARIAKYIPQILKGIGLNDRYRKR